jgi:hypothetical protein
MKNALLIAVALGATLLFACSEDKAQPKPATTAATTASATAEPVQPAKAPPPVAPTAAKPGGW